MRFSKMQYVFAKIFFVVNMYFIWIFNRKKFVKFH